MSTESPASGEHAAAEPTYGEFPECPYCGQLDHDYTDLVGLRSDQDETESTCGNCECTYLVRLITTVRFECEAIQQEARS